MQKLLPTWRFITLLSLSMIGLTAFSGCQTAGKAGTEWHSFRGEVVWVPRDREGTWGIESREFGKIHPRHPIPVEFHRKGLRVTGELLLRGDMGSIRSWGKVAEIRNLELQQ